MSGALVFRNILFVLPVVLVIAQVYLSLRLGLGKLSARTCHLCVRFVIGGWLLVLGAFAIQILTRQISWLPGLFAFGCALYLLRLAQRLSRTSQPGTTTPVTRLPAEVAATTGPAQGLTPDVIEGVLASPAVVAAIKADLTRRGELTWKETWRLGLLVPGRDEYRPGPSPLGLGARTAKYLSDANYRANVLETVPLARSAALYQPANLGVQLDRLTVWGGERKPQAPGYPGWTYGLATQPRAGEHLPIRRFTIDTDRPFAKDRSPQLPAFLREEGFPLRAAYEDGDPFTADRGGTVVLDKGQRAVIHPRYFVHRRLIDDRGDLVDIGLDEGNAAQALAGVQMRPSLSEGLIRSVEAGGYTPVVRYRSVPYASDYLVPLLDTPMSMNGWGRPVHRHPRAGQAVHRPGEEPGRVV